MMSLFYIASVWNSLKYRLQNINRNMSLLVAYGWFPSVFRVTSSSFLGPIGKKCRLYAVITGYR